VRFHQRIKKLFRDSKRSPPKTANCLSKANQAAMGSQIENPQRASYTKASSESSVHTFAVIHQQQVGIEGGGQLNGRFLARVDSC
jgi:hypothetical protein